MILSWNKLCDFAQVIDAFSSSVQAFKQMKNQYGLNESNVDDTVSEIQEVRITTILGWQMKLIYAVFFYRKLVTAGVLLYPESDKTW